MVDVLTKEQRHRCMSVIKSKKKMLELLVGKFLFSRGFWYRLNHLRLPGYHLVLRKYRTAICVKGYFRYGYEGCKYYVFRRQILNLGRIKLSVIGVEI